MKKTPRKLMSSLRNFVRSHGKFCLCVEQLERRDLMAVTPGTLDLSYGVNGVAPAISQSLTITTQFALDANDSSLVFQHRIIGGAAVPGLARYTRSGAVDLSFGNNGIVENLFGTGNLDFYPVEIGVDHLQRIVILGQHLNTLDLQIVRLQADGNLDLSF